MHKVGPDGPDWPNNTHNKQVKTLYTMLSNAVETPYDTWLKNTWKSCELSSNITKA